MRKQKTNKQNKRETAYKTKNKNIIRHGKQDATQTEFLTQTSKEGSYPKTIVMHMHCKLSTYWKQIQRCQSCYTFTEFKRYYALFTVAIKFH